MAVPAMGIALLVLLGVGVHGEPCAPVFSQCGGQGFTGPTCCEGGSTCVQDGDNIYYSQCVPAAPDADGGLRTTPPSAGSGLDGFKCERPSICDDSGNCKVYLYYGTPADPGSVCSAPANGIAAPYSSGSLYCCGISSCQPYSQEIVTSTLEYSLGQDSPSEYPEWAEFGNTLAFCGNDITFCCPPEVVPQSIADAMMTMSSTESLTGSPSPPPPSPPPPSPPPDGSINVAQDNSAVTSMEGSICERPSICDDSGNCKVYLYYGTPADPGSVCSAPANGIAAPYSSGSAYCCGISSCQPYAQDIVTSTMEYSLGQDSPSEYPEWAEFGNTLAYCGADIFFCCQAGTVPQSIADAMLTTLSGNALPGSPSPPPPSPPPPSPPPPSLPPAYSPPVYNPREYSPVTSMAGTKCARPSICDTSGNCKVYVYYGMPADPASICGAPANGIAAPYSSGSPYCCGISSCQPYTQDVVMSTTEYSLGQGSPSEYPEWAEFGTTLAYCGSEIFFCCPAGVLPQSIEDAML